MANNQGCNSIDISNLRLELRLKLRQRLRTRLGRCRIEKWLRCGLRCRLSPSKMSIALHPRSRMTTLLWHWGKWDQLDDGLVCQGTQREDGHPTILWKRIIHKTDSLKATALSISARFSKLMIIYPRIIYPKYEFTEPEKMARTWTGEVCSCCS